MRAAVPSRSFACVALLLTVAVLRPADARAADAGEWLPLRGGERWEYRVSRDHQYAPADANIDRVFSEGTLVREVIDSDASGSEVRETLSLQPILRGARREIETTIGRWSNAGDVLLSAVRSADPGSEQEVRYEPPLRWLVASPEIGTRWDVGTVRWDGTTYAMKGEVLGRETVQEGEQRWEGCLHVRQRGTIGGTTRIFSGPVPISTGHIERLLWFKEGVGIVQERITIQGEIPVPPDGAVARISEVQTRRLVSHRAGQ